VSRVFLSAARKWVGEKGSVSSYQKPSVPRKEKGGDELRARGKTNFGGEEKKEGGETCMTNIGANWGDNGSG